MNEINNMVMYHIRNCLAIGQCKLLRVAGRRNGDHNRRVETILNAPLRNLDRLGEPITRNAQEYVDSLNAQRIGDMVSPKDKNGYQQTE